MARLTLSQFQHQFSQASGRLEDTPVDPVLLNDIIPGGSLSSGAAVDVYRTGHIVRLTEALGETFEAVWWVVGDEHYFRLAREFILSRHSTSYNLSDFGKSFPSFLDEKRPFSDLPFLADLARFEWVFKEVFHCPPHIGLSPDQFQQSMLSGNVCLSFGPSVRLFDAPHSVYEIWKMRGTQQESLPEQDWNNPQRLLCYKHEQKVYVKHVSEQDYQVLTYLYGGDSIENALERTIHDFPDLSTATILDLFALIKKMGIVTALKTKPGLQEIR